LRIILLAIDVRNSSITVAMADVKRNSAEIIFDHVFSSSRCTTVDECVMNFHQIESLYSLDHKYIDSVALCSVDPVMTDVFVSASRKYFGVQPFVVKPGIKSLLKIKIDNPAELGSDILVNSVAAARSGALPAIVIDIGMAVTVSAINEKSEIIGSIISPGVDMSAKALNAYAPQIPLTNTVNSAGVLGTNTSDSLYSGLIRGMAYSINGFVNAIKVDYFAKDKLKVYVKNACSDDIFRYFDFEYESTPHLTVNGLIELYKINNI